MRARPSVFFAGQISGVEGYVESIATGLMAGRNAAGAGARATSSARLPRETALGSLCHYISGADPKHYQPANITFDLLPALDEADARAAAARQEGAPRRGLPARARQPWTNSCTRMSELERQIDRFLEELQRNNASPHTLWRTSRTCGSSWNTFRRPAHEPPAPAEFDVLKIREWLAALYEQKLTAVSMRRKLAALRVFFRFLVREGLAPMNRAAPGAHAAQSQDAARGDDAASRPTRWSMASPRANSSGRIRRAIWRFSNCSTAAALRVSELVGLNLDDFDRGERWLRVRGKGRKERQVPSAARRRTALERYLAERGAAAETALFLNHRGGRLTDRGVRGIVKLYATLIAGRFLDASAQLPARLRHAPAERRRGPAGDSGTAGARAALHHAEVHAGVAHDLMAVYDRAHPKA